MSGTTLNEAFEMHWGFYWDKFLSVYTEANPEAANNELLTKAFERSHKTAYKSGFYMARELSLMNGDLRKPANKEE